MTLNNIEINKTVTVTALAETKKNDFLKLTSMGILPGVRISLVQKKPLIVFQIGFSRFAIDTSLAELIDVE